MQQRPSQQAQILERRRPPGLWWPVSKVVLVPIVLCLGFFVFAQALPEAQYRMLIERYALSSGIVFAQTDVAATDLDIILSFVSHAFLHNSPAHLGLNMVFFYIFAQPLAVRFQTRADYPAKVRFIGSLVFMAFYLSAAVFSGLVYVLSSVMQPGILIGASGAASAMMGASIRVGLRRYQPGGVDQGRPLALWDWKVMLTAVLYVGTNLALVTPAGTWLMAGGDPSSIAWEAHIGGFLYGVVMFSYFDQLTTNRR